MKKPIKVMSSLAFAALIAASSVNIANASQGDFYGADSAGNLTKYPKAVVSANKAALKAAAHRYFEPTSDGSVVDYDLFISGIFSKLLAGTELPAAYTSTLADPTVAAPADVKAKVPTAPAVQNISVSTVNVVNNTTVEVTLSAAPTAAPVAADFTFDNGLTAQSVTLKAGTTSTYTVTTSAQDTTKTYKLSYKGVDTGKTFTGVAVVDIKAVSVINKTTIKVEFTSNIDAVTVDNFAVSAGTIKTVSTPDPKTVLISVDGLNFQQALTVTVKGVKSGAATIADKTFNVTVPSVSDLYELKITTDATNDTITSDGATKTLLTATLTDKQTGLAVTGVNGIVKFVTTKGAVGQDEVAITNGVSTVQLTSAASDSPVTANVSATIIDAPSDRAYEGLIGTKVVTFAPAGTTPGTTTFVTALSAEANQGDRFFVTFSGKIDAAAYKAVVTASGYTGDTYGITIDGKSAKILNVVQKSDNVLEFVLDTDSTGSVSDPTGSVRPTPQTDQIKEGWGVVLGKNYLKDNTIHKVAFPANVGSLVLANTTGINFIMTDAKRPFIYGVTPQDQLNFRVDTSEPIAEDLAETFKDEHSLGDVRDNTSINTAFLIDGKKVRLDSAPTQANIDAAKVANEVIVNALYVGKYTSETDNTRNKIYFKLDPNFKLTAGKHQIQIANIGDWAGVVDNDNMVSTQTFDFTVTADTTKAVPSIEVQSPEQWLITFTKPVASIGVKTVNDVFKIYQADGYAKTPQEGQLVYGTDKDYVITPVDDNGNAIQGGTIANGTTVVPRASKFLIELTRDWTKIYTTSTSTVNYFTSTKNPYKVVVDQLEDTLQNAVDKTVLNAQLQYDGVSPTIVSSVDVYNLTDHKAVTGYEYKATASGSAVLVTMSEPVQLHDQGNTAGFKSNPNTLTPSEKQVDIYGVPVPTFEFVKGDEVVQGHIASGTINEIDKNFIVEPDKPLGAGTWTLYIRSISDDIGNTSATVNSQVVVGSATPVSADTAIAWAAFDNNDATNTVADKDYIYIKFTKVMDPTGASGVNNTTNYVFNGIQLPLGSQIYRGIKNVTDDWDGVTIEMPKNAFDGAKTAINNDFTSVLNVANNFKAADGTLLAGPYEVQLTDTTTPLTVNVPALQNDFKNQDMNFEAVYHNTKGIILGNKAIESAIATDADADGKIDTITLTLDGKVGDGITPATQTTTGQAIKVNADGSYTAATAIDNSDLQTVVVGGKTWTLVEDGVAGDNVIKLVAAKTLVNANQVGTDSIPAIRATATEAIDGTVTTGLTLTAANNNILINLGKVFDQAGSVATLPATTGTTNNATTLVATFSEPLYVAATAVADGADIKDQFTPAGGTLAITSAIYNAANKTVTFTLANAANTNTITSANTLKDKFGNSTPKVYTYNDTPLLPTVWTSN